MEQGFSMNIPLRGGRPNEGVCPAVTDGRDRQRSQKSVSWFFAFLPSFGTKINDLLTGQGVFLDDLSGQFPHKMVFVYLKPRTA